MADSTAKSEQGQSSEQKNDQSQQATQQSTAMATSGQTGQSGASRQQKGLARRGGYFPSMTTLSPIDLLTANPFDLMRRFTEELDKAFESYGLLGQTGVETAITTPAVDVFEQDGNIIVQAEMPGLKADDVKVELTEDGIVISGESSVEREQKREGFYRRERSYGQFYRLIPLPEHADMDKAQAKFNNGLLEIVIPAAESRRKRREIPVQAQESQQSQAATGGQSKS